MPSWVEFKRVLLLSLAVLALGGVAACDDEDEGTGTTDGGADSAGDAAADSGGDTTPDTSTDVTTDTPVEVAEEVEEDVVAVEDACVAFAADLGGGLSDTILVAVQECGRGSCVGCALDGGTGSDCGDGGTMVSCINDCMETVSADSEARTEVQDAVEAGDVDTACLGCYAGTTGCVVGSPGGTLACLEAGCDCNTVLCENGCSDEFGACSGLAELLDVEDCETDPDDENSCAYGSPDFCTEVEAECTE